jgi:TPR repeat protein
MGVRTLRDSLSVCTWILIFGFPVFAVAQDQQSRLRVQEKQPFQLTPPPVAQKYYEIANFYAQQGDTAKCFTWYLKAAKVGHAAAMERVGWMYSHGVGVDRDVVKANYWLKNAEYKGNKQAEQELGDLYNAAARDMNRQTEEWLRQQRAARTPPRCGTPPDLNSSGYSFLKLSLDRADYEKCIQNLCFADHPNNPLACFDPLIPPH